MASHIFQGSPLIYIIPTRLIRVRIFCKVEVFDVFRTAFYVISMSFLYSPKKTVSKQYHKKHLLFYPKLHFCQVQL